MVVRVRPGTSRAVEAVEAIHLGQVGSGLQRPHPTKAVYHGGNYSRNASRHVLGRGDLGRAGLYRCVGLDLPAHAHRTLVDYIRVTLGEPRAV